MTSRAGTWAVTVVGGHTVLARTTTLALAVGQARAYALQGWPAFITRTPLSPGPTTKVEVTPDLELIVWQGDHDSPWIAQTREILRTA